jgi:hypothetical protein
MHAFRRTRMIPLAVTAFLAFAALGLSACRNFV